MSLPRNYILLPATIIAGAVIILITMYVLNDRAINIYTLSVVLIICIAASYFTSKIVSTKYSELAKYIKSNSFIFIFIHLNVYLGIAIGLLSGVLLGWLLFYPYTLLFGHPEERNWSILITFFFGLLVMISTTMSTILSIKYFFNTGIKYIKK